ncbi:MAG: DUF1080 domain-containing protein [Bryobacteraceae bacterium]
MRKLLFVSMLLTAPALFAQDWQNLLPDASFTGWTRITIPPGSDVTPGEHWKVDTATNTVICSGDQKHEWLRYDRVLANFELHVEWRFTPVSTGKMHYNSGVFVRNNDDGSFWHQAQAGGDNGGFWFGDTTVDGATKRINLRAEVTENRIKPPGEWNTYDIRADGPKLTLSTNGKVTSVWDDPSMLKGYIGLESEGYRIEFRNLKLKILK